MTIRLYNTLTGTVEEIRPVGTESVIGFYACGVTVYDFSHLGHARGAILFDVLRGLLQRDGSRAGARPCRVIYVRNITDIDDKIIKRGHEENRPWDEVARQYEQEYYKDMESLRVDRADVEPRATDHIAEIIDMVKGLQERGFAYAADGDIYFSIAAFPAYGKLSKKNLDDLVAGSRVEVSSRKKNPLDFVLWKSSKPGEPQWDSPWGLGRPGWHIECSAMSMKYLGESFCIHGGGADLIFPHHENEIAQSEAFSGKPFARYWLHNAFITVNQEKMSKSLGNFFTIREALKRWRPEAIRHFILKTKYSHPLDFTEENLDASQQAVQRLKDLKIRLDERLAPGTTGLAAVPKTDDRDTAMWDSFYQYLADDFNTARAAGVMFELVTEINKLLDPSVTDISRLPEKANTLRAMDELLKLIPPVADTLEPEFQELITQREQARKQKDFKRSDELRTVLEEKGIMIKDTKDGTHWLRK